MIHRSTLESCSNRPVEQLAPTPSKQFFARALRTMVPTLIALTFASAAHAQGTMDFSGAQTLMGTFKTSDNNLRQQGFAEVFTDKCIGG